MKLSENALKGSEPATRFTAPGLAHRPPQSIIHRRLLRVYRAVAERLRHGQDPNLDISVPLITKVRQVLLDSSSPPLPNASLQVCLQHLNAAIALQDKARMDGYSKAWRKQFAVFASDTWKAAKIALKPPQLVPAFSADEMREEWNERVESTWFPACSLR